MDAVATNALGAGGAGGEAGTMGGSGGEPEPPTPPRLRVAALPEIPAGALAEGFSSLYVAIGCLGGPAFTHPLEADACGRGYAPNSPTSSAVLVTLSRTHAVGKLSLQALHASLASPTLSISSAPPDTAVQASVPIVFDLRRGELKPRQPSTQLTLLDYGLSSPGWRAQASTNGTPLFSERWLNVLERAGIDAFLEGRGYTLVVVGPAGNVGSRGFWNEAAIGRRGQRSGALSGRGRAGANREPCVRGRRLRARLIERGDQTIEKLRLREVQFFARDGDRKVLGAVDLRELGERTGAGWPLHAKRRARELRRIEHGLGREPVHDFSVFLLHRTELEKRTVHGKSGFFRQLAAGRGEWLLVGLDLALRDGPGARVATAKDGAPGMREQHGEPARVSPVDENARALFLRAPDHELAAG